MPALLIQITAPGIRTRYGVMVASSFKGAIMMYDQWFHGWQMMPGTGWMLIVLVLAVLTILGLIKYLRT